MLWEIFVEQRYELGELPEQAQVFDVGANIGIATLFFATRSPGVRIQAYEPDPETFALLQRNVQDNNLKNVQLHNCALSDRNGISPLHVRRELAAGDIGASLEADYRRCFHEEASIEVRSVQLKKLSEEFERWGHADVLKLDIEGAEAGVFRDLGGNFQSISRLAMEYHYLPGHKNPLSRILSPLESYGFHSVIEGPARPLAAPSYELFLKAWAPGAMPGQSLERGAQRGACHIEKQAKTEVVSAMGGVEAVFACAEMKSQRDDSIGRARRLGGARLGGVWDRHRMI
jgi:FkbM family methyltransferase